MGQTDHTMAHSVVHSGMAGKDLRINFTRIHNSSQKVKMANSLESDAKPDIVPSFMAKFLRFSFALDLRLLAIFIPCE